MLQREPNTSGPTPESVLSVFEASPEADKLVNEVIDEIELDARRVGYTKFLERLYDSIGRDNETGVGFSVLADPKQPNSDTEAIIVSGPFATDLKSIVVLAEMIRRLGDVAGLRDEKGRVLPVIALSAPVGNATVKLPSKQKIQVSAGDFTPIAQQYLKTVASFMPDLKAASILGVSFGASMGPVLANVAAKSGIRVKNLIMGVPGNMQYNRPVLSDLLPSFVQEAKASDPYLAARLGVFGKPAIAGVGGLVRQASSNLRLMRGLAAGQFFGGLRHFAHGNDDAPIHMFFSDGDTIARTAVAEHGLRKLNPGRVTARTLATPERHAVVYDQHILGGAVLDAFFKARAV